MSNKTAVQKREQTGLAHFVKQANVMGRFQEVLGERTPQFVSSLLSLSNASHALMTSDPRSIVAAAMTAATLDLPIQKDLGFAHIIPYSGVAQFQIGYKGLVQLAMRSGQYKALNACPVMEGELVSIDKLKGVVVLDESKRKSDTVIGYATYMALTNGFERSEYWDVARIQKHAGKYSQAFKKEKKDSPWFTAFDQMAMKTVLKSMLSHWGPMSVQMQTAIVEDQAVHRDLDSEPEYIDGVVVSEEEVQEQKKGTAGLVDKLKGEQPEPAPSPTPGPATEGQPTADNAELIAEIEQLMAARTPQKVSRILKVCKISEEEGEAWQMADLVTLKSLRSLLKT